MEWVGSTKGMTNYCPNEIELVKGKEYNILLAIINNSRMDMDWPQSRL